MSKTYFLNELADSVSSLNTFSIDQLAARFTVPIAIRLQMDSPEYLKH